ncbi:hypothetical protein O181_063709 [Austropuccinia psidii MF-1]|uniref:Uncharacterized protein n=1 Tax=Austropuccinia psidii MF-1 TaxID=1389203 RepID=A0A9Q3EMN3_9BASI|nr:hypothetical protein [Austropuccinia psidii MF-1]
MSSKLTGLNQSSPSVLCGSDILNQLCLPWSMASSSDFGPSQDYDGYKAVEVLDPACTKCLMKGKECFQSFNTPFLSCWEEAMPLSWNASSQCQEILMEQERRTFWERVPSF